MRVVTMAVVLAALVTGTARAQDRRVVGEIGVGPTFVMGPAGDNVGSGFNFQFGAIYKVNDVFGIKVDSMITSHDVKDEITTALNVGDGDAWVWHLSGSVVLSTPSSRPISAYAVTGLGVYYRKVTLTNPGAEFIEVCNPWLLICYDAPIPADQVVGARSSTDLGLNVGGGLNFRVAQNTAVFVESRFHYVWGPKTSPQVNPLATRSANGQFFPLVFGVRF